VYKLRMFFKGSGSNLWYGIVNHYAEAAMAERIASVQSIYSYTALTKADTIPRPTGAAESSV